MSFARLDDGAEDSKRPPVPSVPYELPWEAALRLHLPCAEVARIAAAYVCRSPLHWYSSLPGPAIGGHRSLEAKRWVCGTLRCLLATACIPFAAACYSCIADRFRERLRQNDAVAALELLHEASIWPTDLASDCCSCCWRDRTWSLRELVLELVNRDPQALDSAAVCMRQEPDLWNSQMATEPGRVGTPVTCLYLRCFPGHDSPVIQHWFRAGTFVSAQNLVAILDASCWETDDLAGPDNERLFATTVRYAGSDADVGLLLEAWLARGSSPSARSREGTSLLCEALAARHWTSAASLLSRGARVDSGQGARGELEVLFSAAAPVAVGGSLPLAARSVLQQLLERKCDASTPWADGKTTSVSYALSHLASDAETVALLRAHADERTRDLVDELIAHRTATLAALCRVDASLFNR